MIRDIPGAGYLLSSTYHYMLGSCRDHRAACEQGWIIAG